MVKIQLTVNSQQSTEDRNLLSAIRYPLSAIYFLFFLTACGSGGTEQFPIKQGAEQEIEEKANETEGLPAMRQFSFVSHNSEGKKEWEIAGDKATFLENNEIKLDNVVAKSSHKEADLLMTSEEGFFDKENKDVRLEGDVKGVFKQQNYVTTITCDGCLEVDNLKKKAVFEENVVVHNKDGKISADKIEVFFNEENKKIVKIVAIGNVQIERKGNRSYSEEAIYLVEQEKIILTGRPRVEIISTDGTDEVLH
ncbi:MAG: LPS export ABC transporter periplasmic protein LptC [Candidatus Omnitrophica bacterium]|nr:LPS export ABC transporter periplasmic protein LptC [Candidatus Omnitrophota bacterium]